MSSSCVNCTPSDSMGSSSEKVSHWDSLWNGTMSDAVTPITFRGE